MRLDSRQARDRFSRARVARLATVGETGAPHIVPVTFALRDDQVAIGIDHKPKSTTRLKRLRNIAAHPRVSLLADEYSETWEDLWWVRADGEASILHGDEPGRSHWWARLAERYPQYRDRSPDGPVIVVDVTHWSGWAYREPAG